MLTALPPSTVDQPEFRDARSFLMGPKVSATVLNWSSLDGKLYDREREGQALESAYRRSTAGNRPLELVLVTGPSGTGKTALAQTLRPLVEKSGGYFLSGKFDQLERNENYYPIVQAFTGFVHVLLERDEETIEAMKKILTPLTETQRMVTDMIPSLEQIVGSKSSKPDTKGAESNKRLVFAFRQFVKAICSPECPLVLFLDDLQWAEPASLDLLSALVNDTEIQGLMVLGACRGNEVSIDDHLSVTLREMEAHQVAITSIAVKNLELDAINTMISGILHLSKDECEPLAELVCRQTGGNIFFVIQFLRSLSEEGLLYQDAKQSKWNWKTEEEILNKLDCETAVKLVADKIQRLPRDVLDVLMVASCFGAEFDEYLLHEVVTSDVSRGIEIAEEKGLIERSYAGWRFMHDQIQQSAYSLIPEHERAQVHLQIGRKLWSALASDELGLNTSLVVNQLRHGAHLIEDQEERDRMAVLLLRAGEMATASSAFFTAASHLNLGISMLNKRYWRDQYHLSLDLYNAAAEVEYCNANFDRMEELVNEVLENARNINDKTRALTTSIYSLGSRNELQKAIDLGLQVLGDLDERIPTKGRTITIILEFMKTRRMLRKLSDDDILNLPRMHDEKKVAATRIMTLLFLYTLTGRPMLAPVIVMRWVQLTIEHGSSAMACAAFSSLAMLLCTSFGQVELGMRYARLSLVLMDKFQAKEWLARVYVPVYGFCFTMTESLSKQLKPLLLSHRLGLGSGDIEYAMLAGSLYAGVALEGAAVPLPQLLEDMSSCLSLMKHYKQTNMVQFLQLNMQFALNMAGRCNDPQVLTGEAMDEDKYLKEAAATQNEAVTAFLHHTKLLLHCYFQNYAAAESAACTLETCDTRAFAPFTHASNHLHKGLASIALCQTQTRRRIRITRRCIQDLKVLARYGPDSYLSKVHLLEAEVSAVRGKLNEALEKYEMSIACAQKDGMWHETGLACERAAMFLRGKVGQQEQAITFWQRALVAYEQWGAQAKVSRIKEELAAATV